MIRHSGKLGAMPLFVLTALSPKNRPDAPSLFHELIVSPTAVFVIIGIWKTLLFLPRSGWSSTGCAGSTAWARWLAAAVVCIEPNFAAHIPLPTLDILGVEGTLFGCYACWNYLRHPTAKSLWATGLLFAMALLFKHTTVVLPFVAVVYAVLWWIGAADAGRPAWMITGAHLKAILLAIVTTIFCLSALMMFDVSSRACRANPRPRGMARPPARLLQRSRLPFQPNTRC